MVSARSGVNKTSKFTECYCEYNQEESIFKFESRSPIITKGLPVSFIRGNMKDLIETYKLAGYQTKQDREIPFPHQLIYSDKGKLQSLEISLGDDLNLNINTFQRNLIEEEALQFVKKLALYFKDFIENREKSSSNQQNLSSSSFPKQTLPLSQDEEIIRNFVARIEEGKANEAAKMMKINQRNASQARSEFQAWAAQFAAITSFKLLKIEKASEDQWSETRHIYRVTFDVRMDPRSAKAPIPYYGWENGLNIRWIILEKEGNVWKIARIATSP